MAKFILIDSDNDSIKVNENSTWEYPEDCFADIKQAIRDEDINGDYLPWKLVHFERGKRRNAMLVHTRIKSYTTDIVLNKI